MSIKVVNSKNAKETQNAAANLAKNILARKPARMPGFRAVVLTLSGELGTGKTTFVQGFAKGLGIKEKILSPTFTIVKKFKIQNSKSQIIPKSKITNPKQVSNSIKLDTNGFKNFYHIDCYRLENPKEILDLGFKEIIKNPQNIVAIEWPEKIKKILPNGTIGLKLNHIGGNKRKVFIAW